MYTDRPLIRRPEYRAGFVTHTKHLTCRQTKTETKINDKKTTYVEILF